jgi:endonuclease YncB( thermonuclease family)
MSTERRSCASSMGVDAIKPQADRCGPRWCRQYLESLLPHTPHGIIVRTRKDKQEKYGRWLAEVVVHHDDPMTVNQRMIEAGHAVEYHGGKR